jgi:hypothetical protein
MTFKLKPDFCREKLEKLKEKSAELNHIIVVNEYEDIYASLTHEEIQKNSTKKRIPSSKEAKVTVLCQVHPEAGLHKTTVCKYLRSRKGLLCCGRAQVGEKFTGRVFSSETIDKMSISKKEYHAKKRGNRTPQEDKRNLFNDWRTAVQKKGNYVCAVVQIRPSTLHAHHIFSKKVFPSLELDPDNGVLLASNIHEAFHEKYGHLNIVTMDHFLDFLEILMKDKSYRIEIFKKVKPRSKNCNFHKLISNQATQSDAGSETISSFTPGPDPEVEKEIVQNLSTLYKNMEELREVLFQKLSEQEKKLALNAFEKPIVARYFEYENNNL